MAKDDEFFVARTVSGDATTSGGMTADEIGVLDAVEVPIIVLSRERTIARINRAAMTVFGLKVSDLGRPLGNTFAGVEDLNRICTRVIADGAPHRIESRDGDRRFLLRIAPYTGNERRILGAVLTFTNVTAFRASIEQAIYEREYTKAILNTVVDPVVVLDAKLQIQTANRAFYSVFGVSRDQTQGISILKIGNFEWESSQVWASVRTALSGPSEFQAVEIDHEFPVGRRTLLLEARRLAGAGDSQIVLTFHDVTERKLAERTASLLAAIVDSSDDAILSKKLDGTITSWNQSAQRLFGYGAEEAVGQHITLIVPWERRSEEEDILRRLAGGERVDHFETVRKRKDGTTLDVALTISPIRDAAGRVIGASKVARDITERKQAERALSEQARLLDLSNDAIFVRDAEDQVTYWNKAATELYGFTRNEALGRVTHEMLQTQFPEHLEKINQQLHRDGRWNGELVHTRKDGTKIAVISRWVLDREANGNARCILETNNDITQSKRTEKALRESEERFRAIVETTPECVKLMSADGTLLHMNRPGLAMVGARSADEVVGKSVYDLIAPEDRSRFEAFNEKICRGEQGSLQFDMVGLDGKRRHMETHAAPLRNPDETVVHLAVTADISERKQAQDLLRTSEERFRALVNASSDVVYRISPDWSEMRELDGRGFIADMGKPRKDWLNEYIHPDDQPLVLRTIREAVRTKSTFGLEHRVRRTDGTLGWTYSRAVPLLNVKGEILEWFGAAGDVTARKEAEENFRKLAQTLDAEVRARTRELEEQSNQVRALSWRLLRSQDEERRHIARELHDSAGQTLTVLGISLAQLAQKTGRNAPELASEAEQIQETVQQLHREIRTTSYLLHPPLLDENGLYSAISWYVQGLLERSGLEVQLDISKEFGRLPRDMELVIFRLVQECLTNIHRHSESKTASIRIARDSNQITLDIRDQGKGMSPARLAEIESGRSGVGIGGMRERLRQFEGTMNIESDSSGTRIFGTIPLHKATSPDESKAESLEARVPDVFNTV
ncbi:MAG TPA: PAS domain S-box protein [Candidatus Aquilonibacter sp.]|jgi:PAS domain S-box-containing protein|nr:PAS domain S-box protein [Candidatus Aquilonibacter sp.]